MDIEKQILSDITVHMKYAKFLPELNRRETWEEIVERNRKMHLDKYKHLGRLGETIDWVYDKFVQPKKVLPSMRSMQFAGKAIEVNPIRMYNCSYLPIDSVASFHEVIFLLLCGCGVGFSCQSHHVRNLPEIRKPNPNRQRRFLIADSIEGWSDSVKVLFKSYFGVQSSYPVFDFREIRPKGTLLRTSGGIAPGPQPLKEMLVIVQGILDNKKDGDKLTTLEVHDIICHISDAVLAGGIRRSALISMFSADDNLMMSAKSDKWYELNPQRGRANNSALLLRHRITKDYFFNIWEKIHASGSGEPGVYLSNDKDWSCNPCIVGETRVAVADGRNSVSIEELYKMGDSFPVYSAKKSFTVNKRFMKWSREIKSARVIYSGEKEVVKIVLSNGDSFECTKDHRLALPNGEFIQAKNSLGVKLENFFTLRPLRSSKHRYINVKSDAHGKQHKLIWEFYNGEVPDGYVIDHQVNNGDDSLSNLQLLTKSKHDKKSGIERIGKNNGVHKIKNNTAYRNKLSIASFGSNNPRHSGLSDLELIAIGRKCLRKFGVITKALLINMNDKFPHSFSKNRFGGSFSNYIEIVMGNEKYVAPIRPVEQEILGGFNKRVHYDYWSREVYVTDIVSGGKKVKVYDLQVEDNYNFYIITSGSQGYANSRGVLIHNCGEISLRPYQFCNLTEINASDIEDQHDLEERVMAASILGTLQAGYTDFHYIRDIWKRNTEKDALLGISMTGIASNKYKGLDLPKAVQVAADTNTELALVIGINKATRITSVKPAGTTSLALGTSSGIHAWYDEYYIRRIRVSKEEAIYKYLNENFPELLEDDYFRPHDRAIICVPQKAPEGASLRHESPIETLERIKFFYENWIQPGFRSGQNGHSISATIFLKPGEWDEVGNWMWDNKDVYNGLSILPYDGGTYIQAPFETCTKEKYEEMLVHLKEIDLSQVQDFVDKRDLRRDAVACSGSSCEVI